ncbi:hypothetical protein [Pseudoflavonifractor capillosus]|uniref:hypothetical protein n=1 Tax=Pseudoflavonifractor capillosus TaxID=106588 RepID=UPI002A840CB0|nr:hypothetical protein [Pseudoflavonifractor capillosus]MDY4661401.1 hypothetical protein [Pseudoflavonifractor capillosus]
MPVKIRCVWEHNGGDSLLYAVDLIGAYTRGASRDAAIQKMPAEISAYLKWRGDFIPGPFKPEVIQEKNSSLTVSDADSDVIFEDEKSALSMSEYLESKALVLKSAQDFLTLYQAIPDKNKSCLQARETFYGQVPRTAVEMYEHTKNVNDYYFGEIGVSAGNEGDIVSCRKRGFELLEHQPDFLNNTVCVGSYEEEWSLRKVLRRFIWHDRIHAKAMYRMAIKTFGPDVVPNIFCFDV